MIVVFGSLNADLVFPVASLPRPGETILTPEYTVVPGGKGANQAVAAARAGSETRMVGSVGQDSFGDILIDSLKAAGVAVDGVARAAQATGCAAIAVDTLGQNQIAVAGGANLSAEAAQVPDDWLGPGTLLLLQMETRPAENWALAARAHAAGARVVLNAAPAAPVPPSAFAFLDVLIVNEIESAVVAKSAGLPPETVPVEAARGMARRFDITCIVTLGGDGAFACMADAEWATRSLDIAPVDTTGAGDAFTGVFAAALDAGAELAEALRRAGVGGALACLAEGAQTSMPAAAEIDRRLADLPPARPPAPTSQDETRHEAE